MPTFKKVILLLALSFIGTALQAQEIPWEKIKKDYDYPASRKGFDSAIVDRVPIISLKDQKIPQEYLAVASMFYYYKLNGYTKISIGSRLFGIFSKVIGNYERPDGPVQHSDEDLQKQFKAALQERYDLLGKEALELTEKADLKFPTEGQLIAFLMHSRGTTTDKAIQKLLYENFCYIKNIRRFKANAQTGKIMLNIGFPFIIKNNNQFYVCIGYWDEKDNTYFIVADMSKAEQVKISQREFNRLRRIMKEDNDNKSYDTTMVDDDMIFSLADQKLRVIFQPLKLSESMEFIIVPKTTYGEDIVEDFLENKLKEIVEKK